MRSLGDILRAQRGRWDDPALEVMSRLLYVAQYEFAHRWLHRHSRADAEVLDWGAGVGHFAFVQSRLGRRVTAYSVAPNEYNRYNDVLEAVAAEGGFAVRIGDHPVRLPFEDASFDVAVSCGVLEHVREFGGSEEGSLEELRRVLRPAGLFVCLHLPNQYSWIECVNRALGRSHHGFTYSSADVRRLAGATNFEIVRHQRYGILPKVELARRLGGLADRGWLTTGYMAADRALAAVGAVVAQNHFTVWRAAS